MSKKLRLGELLLSKGLIDESKLENALSRQKQWGGRLGMQFVELGYLDEITLLKFLSDQLKFECADLTKVHFMPEVYSLITTEIAKKYHVIPLTSKESAGKHYLFLAMSDPNNMLALEEIEFLTNHRVKPIIATDSQIENAIEHFYDEKTWVQIEPLTDKIKTFDLDESNMEIFHEVPMKEQVQEEEAKKKKESIDKDPQLLALIRVLVKKGVFTRKEYLGELKQIKAKKT